jgi:hypothetical protein
VDVGAAFVADAEPQAAQSAKFSDSIPSGKRRALVARTPSNRRSPCAAKAESSGSLLWNSPDLSDCRLLTQRRQRPTRDTQLHWEWARTGMYSGCREHHADGRCSRRPRGMA